MNWTGPADLKQQVQKIWDKGALLSQLAGAPGIFPLKLKLRCPTSSEMSAHFALVKDWATSIRSTENIRIVEKTINHQVLGKNSLPTEVWIDSLDNALDMIKKSKAAKSFAIQVECASQNNPQILSWLQKNSLRALAVKDDWEKLLDVVDWYRENARPMIYLRQIDLPGIHTKFVEKHQSILSELLGTILDNSAIEKHCGSFEERFGFLLKPTMVRFRILDPEQKLLPGDGPQDTLLDLDSFAKLSLNFETVFITENEINYLAFPNFPNSLILFGKGFLVSHVLTRTVWLTGCKIYYWGDIDTHGFSILNQARSTVPGINSLLMDRETLDRHKHMLVEETTARPGVDYNHLTEAEQQLCRSLSNFNGFANARLEQERISWSYACNRIDELRADKD